MKAAQLNNSTDEKVLSVTRTKKISKRIITCIEFNSSPDVRTSLSPTALIALLISMPSAGLLSTLPLQNSQRMRPILTTISSKILGARSQANKAEIEKKSKQKQKNQLAWPQRDSKARSHFSQCCNAFAFASAIRRQ